ncbi:MAG: tyrosine-type recombinase/integrase, partial [Ignavibacteria bacterium]|nr:tyrosine-type recombinase/integrase [Ignavibacteria bacterium]
SKKYSQSVKYTFAVLEKVIPGETPLARITGNELEKFFIDSFQQSKSTALLYFRIIRAALNKAIQWNYILENPTSKIKLPKIPTKINQYLSAGQFQTILHYEETELFKDVFVFAYNTGMRLSEITNLKLSSINLSDRTIKISNTESFTTKGKEERIIPINNTLYDVIIKRTPKVFSIYQDPFLFNLKGIKLNGDTISRHFKVSLRTANKFGASINPLTHFHTLRGSFITNLAKRNVPLHIVQKLVGHESLSVTSKYYLSVQTESMHEAMRTLDTKPEGLINANNLSYYSFYLCYQRRKESYLSKKIFEEKNP